MYWCHQLGEKWCRTLYRLCLINNAVAKIKRAMSVYDNVACDWINFYWFYLDIFQIHIELSHSAEHNIHIGQVPRNSYVLSLYKSKADISSVCVLLDVSIVKPFISTSWLNLVYFLSLQETHLLNVARRRSRLEERRESSSRAQPSTSSRHSGTF
jgi:hypothetical protein